MSFSIIYLKSYALKIIKKREVCNIMVSRNSTFKETVQLFMTSILEDIKNEFEIPNINFVFSKDAIVLAEKLKKEPFVSSMYNTPCITDEDVERILPENNMEDCPTIFVKDTFLFFSYLMEITNSFANLRKYYDNPVDTRLNLIKVLKTIWLRMGISDFNDVELFLSKQLQFINNTIFDRYKSETHFTNFYDYEVKIKCNLNSYYDEACRSISFSIYGKDGSVYDLPRIHFGIDNEYNCYIYAIQNKDSGNKDKKIERLLYKLNKDVEIPSNHPSQVFAMLLFIKLLKEYRIDKIKIPSMQVLSYRYHEILSEGYRNNFHIKWNQNAMDSLEHNYDGNQDIRMAEYERDKRIYEHVVNNQDEISKLKTENLYNLLYRMLFHDDTLQVVNEPNIQGDYLEMNIKGKQ